MIKNRPIDLASTNVALIGTDIDKKCREHASNGEPAWKTAGKQSGIEVWRVNKFKLEQVPEKRVGSFHEGDSYIILETKKSDKGTFEYDIFFWLGKFTTPDEAGVAAYKTVELDDHLNDLPVQHREVEGCESEEFTRLFAHKGGVRLLKGGHDTGFHHVQPEQYQARLLRLTGTNVHNIRVIEVELNASSLNSSDVFILDGGLNVFEFIGKSARPAEKSRAGVLSRSISDEREGLPSVQTIDETDQDGPSDQFWQYFGGRQSISETASAEQNGPSHPKTRDLYNLVDDAGKYTFNNIASGQISRSLLKSDQVYVLDAGNHVYVWVGNGTPKEEKKVALQKAIDFLKAHNRPHALPLTRVHEGHETESFRALVN